MKTIGLIGGMSWESTAVYYRIVNQAVRERLGGAHSASVLLYSFDFAEIERLQHEGDWDRLGELMVDAGRALERGGADFLLICTNTMHLLADRLTAAVPLPLLHVVDAAGEKVAADAHRTIGLLGTAFTMEKEFYKGRLTDRFGFDVLVPEADDRRVVHDVIYDELISGRVEPASRAAYRDIIARLIDRGAEAIILGCTEIMLLVTQEDSAVPLYDTTTIHAQRAVDLALA